MAYMEKLPFEVGDEIKNYKAMCELLGEKVRAGESKKAQLKRWEKHFNWTKKGHRFIISEIMDSSFPTHDNNLIGKGVKEYNKYVQKLILHMLLQYSKASKENRILIANKGIIIFLELFYKTFFSLYYNGEHKTETAEKLDIKESFITEFYKRVNYTTSNDIRTALKQLQYKSLIYVTDVLLAKPKDSRALGMTARDFVQLEDFLIKHKHNDLVQDFFNEYGIVSEKVFLENNHSLRESTGFPVRITTHFEKSAMILFESIVLKELELKSMTHAFAQNKERIVRQNTKLLMEKYLGIYYTYTGYEIVFAKPVLENLELQDTFYLSFTEQKRFKKLLNQNLRDAILKNYNNFYNKSKDNYSKSLGFQNDIDKETGEIFTQWFCQLQALSAGQKSILSVQGHIEEIVIKLLNIYMQE